MTTTPLTISQRCEVATEVEQREYVELCLGPNGGGISYALLKSDPHNVMWKPDFKGKDWQRLQALALVGWLADWFRKNCYAGYMNSHPKLVSRIIEALMDHDIPALERMVYDLKDQTHV